MDQNKQVLQDEVLDEISIEKLNTKDSEVSDNEESSNAEGKETLSDTALLNDVVLRRLFGFLGLQDIKNCRLVCSKWNTILEPILRKRFVLALRPKGDKSFEEFKKVFQNAGTDLPFINLKLQNWTQDEEITEWTTSQINEVMGELGKTIKYFEVDMRV